MKEKELRDFVRKFAMLNARDQEEILRIMDIKLEMDKKRKKRKFFILKKSPLSK